MWLGRQQLKAVSSIIIIILSPKSMHAGQPGTKAPANLGYSNLYYHQKLVVLFAAGNSGLCDLKIDLPLMTNGVLSPANIPYYDPNKANQMQLRTLGDESVAKNVITVGSCESNRPLKQVSFSDKYPPGKNEKVWGDCFSNPKLHPQTKHTIIRDDDIADNPEGMAATSGRGPPNSGRRIKPDVVAPSSRILSARSTHLDIDRFQELSGLSQDPKWWLATGTSMATPLVAGCCAVVRGALRSPRSGANCPDPSAALIKAIIINGAVRLRGQYAAKGVKAEFGPVDDAPNYHYGFGRVNLDNSLQHVGRTFFDAAGKDAMEQGKSDFKVVIPIANVKPAVSQTLKVTLVWTDPDGEHIQNDLNLAVIAPDGKTERHGNMGDRTVFTGNADVDYDHDNNVEQVKWKGVQEGKYTVCVRAYNVHFGEKTQPFALAWRVYPTDDR
ncbi:peptidase S8/S53 domain-containing protein [Cercophora newfieldiana]|uniref:Peptidase S8/S53 domain-containing protein n=1 Tax=Cercophora newfieldiana TaxID=92897 RepID=A0AA40CR31_9PEZI|nr:peptidase S8/S53 domain-containing protein [Cercophora newfieldiana]